MLSDPRYEWALDRIHIVDIVDIIHCEEYPLDTSKLQLGEAEPEKVQSLDYIPSDSKV